jgi:uncharacterized PurR-regulated membrane protein YhhQ (DUF165 family)
MIPILRALTERLLNEPTFFLSACAAAAVVVQQQVDLPGWVAPVAVLLFGVATRAVVRPERQVRAARKKLLAARRAQSRRAG